MTRRWLTVSLAAAMLVFSACSGPSEPEASTPSPATASPDRSLDEGSSTPEKAQALLDDAIAALAQVPSVEVIARRPLAMNGPDPVDQMMRAAWWPQDQAWIGVTTLSFGRREFRTQVLVVDGRTYIRSRTSDRDFTGNWLDVTKDKSDQTDDWPFDEVTSSIVASNATTSGDTTTIVGRIPTAGAIQAFSVSDDELLPSVRDELAEGTTLVTVTVVDGFPRELSVFGRDVQLPDQGIPQLSMDVLSRRFFVVRFAPGGQERAPRRPPPSQVDRLRTVVDY